MTVETINPEIIEQNKNCFEKTLNCMVDKLFEDIDLPGTQHLERNSTEVDVSYRLNMLLKHIKSNAQKKNFIKAESMRHKLYDLAPHAINTIYASGRFIEKEKNKIHLDKLRKILNNDEFMALKKCLKNIVFTKKILVVPEGEINSNLFFIYEGGIYIPTNTKQNFNPSDRIDSGSVAGVETFFSQIPAKKTIMVTAGTGADYLTRKDLKGLSRQFPEIEKKLLKFCSASINESCYMNPALHSRRENKCYKIKGIIRLQTMNSWMKPVGQPVLGSLINISRSGITFKVNKNKTNTDCLNISKKACVALEPDIRSSKKALTWNGRIVEVRESNVNELIIHFEGDYLNKSISRFISKLIFY